MFWSHLFWKARQTRFYETVVSLYGVELLQPNKKSHRATDRVEKASGNWIVLHLVSVLLLIES